MSWISRASSDEIEGLSNGYGKYHHSRNCDGVQKSSSNGNGTRAAPHGDEEEGDGYGELGDLQEEEIIWGDAVPDIGFQPATGVLQKMNDKDVAAVSGNGSSHSSKVNTSVSKAKRSSLLTMEMQKASISPSVSRSPTSSPSSTAFTAGRLRSSSMVKDSRVGLALLEPSEHLGYGGGNLKCMTNHLRSNGGDRQKDGHGERMPQSAPVSEPVWMRRSHSCFVTEAEKQEAEAEADQKRKQKDTVHSKQSTAVVYGDGEEDEGSDLEHEALGDDDHRKKKNGNAGGGRSWIPPHEIVARSQSMTFSVCEGAGRTLKGMDLRRVRNAVWSRTGFVD